MKGGETFIGSKIFMGPRSEHRKNISPDGLLKNRIIDDGISAIVDRRILKFNKLVLQMIFCMIRSLFISSEVPIDFITSDNPMASEDTISETFVVGHVLCSRSIAFSCESVQVPICAFF